MRWTHALALSFLFTGTAAAELPPLIPRAVLFGNPERSQPQLSPDGQQIAWLAPAENGVLNVWVDSLGKNAPRAVTNETHRPIGWYHWSGDGAHVLYLQDNGGDEIDHLWSADLSSGNVRDLTPFRGVRAQNVITDMAHPHELLVALNLRNRQAFDLYRVDLESGALRLEAKNPGDVLSWTPDNNFVLRAATAFDGTTGSTLIRVRDAADKPWRDLVTMPFERALFDGQVVAGSLIAGFDPDGTLLVHSALHSDKGRLVRVDLQSGAEAGVLAENARADIANEDGSSSPAVMFNPITHAVEAVLFDDGTPHWNFRDPAAQADMEEIERRLPGFPEVTTRDRANEKWLISVSRSDKPKSYALYDRRSKTLTPFLSDNSRMAQETLPAKELVTIPTPDGLTLVSYLTVPGGAGRKGLPLVLLIHGGPWFRDTAAYDPEVQFLVNRGYAVLQVNYRGSTGFGLAFLNAGTNEWGRKTQEDLFTAAEWAIHQGIADPKRIAAMGWSGGGFATLRALEMRPDLFRCGVDGVGPADLATLFRSFPSYWSNIMTRWRRRAGDMDHDKELNRKVSPLYHIDQIRAPLLIGQGANDPRVTIANVDRMVSALRDAKREVQYVVYPDEGHGFARPENQIDFYGRVEEFLAKQLGGRAEPWQKVAGATAELR